MLNLVMYATSIQGMNVRMMVYLLKKNKIENVDDNLVH